MYPNSKINSETTIDTGNRMLPWQQRATQIELPVNPQISQKIKHLMLDDNCDAVKLAQLIKQDPVLVLYLYKHTQAQLQQRHGDIQNLVHLIGLIGFKQIDAIVEKSLSPNTKNPRSQTPLTTAVAASFYAGSLSTLLEEKHNIGNERLFIPTVLFLSPLWSLCVAAPKAIKQLETLLRKRTHLFDRYSEQLLGFRLTKLLTAIGKEFLLPELSAKALAINISDDIAFWGKVKHYNETTLKNWFHRDKKAIHKLNNIETGIYLLNLYALYVHINCPKKHIERYKYLLCQHLKISTDTFDTQAQSIVKNIKIPEEFNKNISHLKQPQDTQEPTAVIDGTGNASTEPAECKETITKSQSIAEALNKTQQALVQSINIEHCIIMRISGNHIFTHSCHGFNNDSGINTLEIDTNRKSIFSQLAKKPGCLQLSIKDISKASSYFPKELLEYCSIKPCSFISIFSHNAPVALIYCDHKNWNQSHHKKFKSICNILSKTLVLNLIK